MKNNSLKEIAQKISEAKSILLFPHVNPDGDTLGSCAALCKALRGMNKETWILLEDDIPANLCFLDNGYCTENQDIIAEPDICMCVDCGSEDRFEKRAAKFRQAKTTICIDHHGTTEFMCDCNYVDAAEAATGQIIFDLLKELEIQPDKEIGEAIFTAITTDTGNYQYSNTQKKSHLITAELYDWGVDCNKVSIEIYENVRMEKIMVKNRAMETLKVIGGGLGVIVYVTQAMLEETGAVMDETEGLSQDLRSIAGVEYAAVVKEYDANTIKMSLRAKTCGDVATVARHLGGGGHTKAAGCTLHTSLEEALKRVEEEFISAIKELEHNN